MLAAWLPCTAALADRGVRDVDLGGGKTLTYTFVRPDDFKADRAYPVVIALPGGGQTRGAVNGLLSLLDPECRNRGWVVICPEAMGDLHYFDGGEVHVPALLANVRSWCRVEGGKFHLAGVSNGGISAFRLAINEPDRFASLIVFPGFPPEQKDLDNLGRLKGIPIRMFVGSDDTVNWVDVSKRTEAEAKKQKLDCSLTIFPGEPHMLRSLTGARIFDMLDGFRKPAETADPDVAAVGVLLDTLHDAASKAEEKRYFDLYAPEGVFIGTDATERWNVEQFRAYAHPYFSKGRGWTYKPRLSSRHIDLAPVYEGQPRNIAWFDELLDNEKYGLCRGSGVARKIDGQWKISQYHLTVPVPNELLERVAKLIAAEERKPKPQKKTNP